MKPGDIFPTPKTNIRLVYVDRKTGEETEIDLGSNVITNLGRSNMAHLLAGDDVADRRVSVVKFGNGGHNPESPTTALIPTTSDTELGGDVIITKSVTYTFPDGNNGTKVMFEATVEADEGNGDGAQAYSEVGLFDLEDRMLTRKCFGLITKSDQFSIRIQYTILF